MQACLKARASPHSGVQAPRKARLRAVRVFAHHDQRQRNEARPVGLASASAKLCGVAAAAAVLLAGGPAAQARTDKVAEWGASGIIFKDSVELLAFDDKDVEGVTIYVTDFKRSITEKLARDFFNEPSQASVTCAFTGPVNIKDLDAIRAPDGKEIFSERKNALNFMQNKTLRVRRVFDEKNNTLVYVAYSTRFTSSNDEGVSTGRYRTSVCALPLVNAPGLAAPVAQPVGEPAAAQ